MKHDPLTSLYTVWIPGKYGASRPGKWCEEDPVRAEIDKVQPPEEFWLSSEQDEIYNTTL